MVAPGLFPTRGSTKLYPDAAEYETQVSRVPVGRVGLRGRAQTFARVISPGLSTGTASLWTGVARWTRARTYVRICKIREQSHGSNFV